MSNHITRLAKDRIADVRRKYGAGWARIGREAQENAIAREFASIVLANEHTTAPDAVSNLVATYREMLKVAGLDGGPQS